MTYVISGFQENHDNGLNNDGVDEEMIVGWVESAIDKEEYNEHPQIVVRDCFFAVAIPRFLAQATSALEQLTLESHIEFSYLASPYFEENDFDQLCIDAICKNTNLTSLKVLKVFADVTDEMNAQVAAASHLDGLVLEQC